MRCSMMLLAAGLALSVFACGEDDVRCHDDKGCEGGHGGAGGEGGSGGGGE